MTEKNVSVTKQAAREFKKLPDDMKKAFTTHMVQALEKGEYSALETVKFRSVHTSVYEVKVKGRPAGRMFYTTLLDGHIEVLAFATKSRSDQDPAIKATVEQRFKDFKSDYGVR